MHIPKSQSQRYAAALALGVTPRLVPTKTHIGLINAGLISAGPYATCLAVFVFINTPINHLIRFPFSPPYSCKFEFPCCDNFAFPPFRHSCFWSLTSIVDMFRCMSSRIVSPRVVFHVPCKFPLSFGGRRFFSRAAANRPTDWIGCNDKSSSTERGPTRSPQSPRVDSDEESPLDQHQLAQLFSGRWPADLSGEEIRIRTSLKEYHQFFDAFSRPSLTYVVS